MALVHAPPHLTTCDCGFCPDPQLQIQEKKIPDETTMVAKPRERKDYFDEGAYETTSDSDAERTKKDEQIRQAPYLPRIQVWARDDGPYTLRVGKQWFHCDDLLINGDEYRQHARKLAAASPVRSTQPTTPGGQSKRRPINRAASYQRTRPDSGATSRPAGALVRQPSRDKVSRSGGYGSQALPEPRRKHTSRRVDDGVHKNTESRRNEDVKVPSRGPSDSNTALDTSNNQLVQYQPPSASDPPPAYKPPRQPRPGRISRGNSYQIPVRSKSKKNVRFAGLPN